MVVANVQAGLPVPYLSDTTCEFVPLAPLVVPAYLQSYGFSAADDQTWRTTPKSAGEGASPTPQLEINVVGHKEMGGHTWYSLSCSLEGCREKRALHWKLHKRLVQLQKDLHEGVKRELGCILYDKHFANAPFARKGGFPGTTSRLHQWCQALADCLNRGLASPSLAALVIYFLDAPEPDSIPDEPVVSGILDGSDSEFSLNLDDEEVAGGSTAKLAAFKSSGSVHNSSLKEVLDHHVQRRELVLIFGLPSGVQLPVTFTRSPIGLDFAKSKPLTLKRVRPNSHAQELAVVAGWKLLRVDGVDVTQAEFAELYTLLKKVASELPRQATK